MQYLCNLGKRPYSKSCKVKDAIVSPNIKESSSLMDVEILFANYSEDRWKGLRM